MAKGPYIMTRGQAAAGIVLRLDKVSYALNGAEIICKHGGDETVAVYLHTVAIEELGKALLIDGLFAGSGGGRDLEVPREWFVGTSAHDQKFERALSALPEEAIAYQMADVCCDQEKVPRGHAKRLEGGQAALKDIHDIESKLYRMYGGEPPRRHKGCVITYDYDRATGRRTSTASPSLLYDAGRVHITVPYDFATRKNMLYADWDDEKKRWNSDATIGPTKYVTSEDDIRLSVEVDKDKSELYPDAVLGAISAFRDAVSTFEWASGAEFTG